MKKYTITKVDDYDDNEWSMILELKRLEYLGKTKDTFQEYFKMEKEFMKIVENFLKLFYDKDSLYYTGNDPDLYYESILKYEIGYEILPEDITRKMVKEAHEIAIYGIDNCIDKAYKEGIWNNDRVKVKSKEEALCNMKLTFRNLLDIEITDIITGATIETGNSGLYLLVDIPDNISVKELFKGVDDLMYRKDFYDENEE